MPLRTMLTQHILDKPLTPSCTSQYLSCTKCSYEGLNRTWKNRGCWKEAPKNALTMSSELLASSLLIVSICNPLVANAFHGRESTHAHWRMHKTLHDQAMTKVNMPNVPLQGLQPALRHIERFSASSFSSSCRVEEHQPMPAFDRPEGLPIPGAHRPSPSRRKSFLANGWRFPHRICE